MITRVYALNSRKYKDESTYWLSYAFKAAALVHQNMLNHSIRPAAILATKKEISDRIDIDLKKHTEFAGFDDEPATKVDLSACLKRLECLRIAVMIDNGHVKNAKILLEKFLKDNDFTHDEQDSKLLMKSLLGIIKKKLATSQTEA